MFYFLLGISLTLNAITMIALFLIIRKKKELFDFNQVTDDINLRKDFLGF